MARLTGPPATSQAVPKIWDGRYAGVLTDGVGWRLYHPGRGEANRGVLVRCEPRTAGRGRVVRLTGSGVPASALSRALARGRWRGLSGLGFPGCVSFCCRFNPRLIGETYINIDFCHPASTNSQVHLNNLTTVSMDIVTKWLVPQAEGVVAEPWRLGTLRAPPTECALLWSAGYCVLSLLPGFRHDSRLRQRKYSALLDAVVPFR